MPESESGKAPPLPARPGTSRPTPFRSDLASYGSPSSGYYNSYGRGYGTTFAPPAYGMYGGGGTGYGGGYGTYGGSYGYAGSGFAGPYGAPNPAGDNAFVRLAEENSRPAFETIQSIVHTFGSISMMFESTYYALHSSFRAVLSVVEHLSRVRLQFSQFMSAFAMMRLIRWLYSQLRRLAGLSVPEAEATSVTDVGLSGDVGQEAAAQEFSADSSEAGGVKWPIVIYLGLVMVAPYLMWKLVASVAGLEMEKSEKEIKHCK